MAPVLGQCHGYNHFFLIKHTNNHRRQLKVHDLFSGKVWVTLKKNDAIQLQQSSNSSQMAFIMGIGGRKHSLWFFVCTAKEGTLVALTLSQVIKKSLIQVYLNITRCQI